MSFWIEHELARRALRQSKKGFLRWIILVAQSAVALSLAVMILTICFVQGFQKEIAEKVFGFWGHISITHAAQDRSLVSYPVRLDTSILEGIREIDRVWLTNDGEFNWFSEREQKGYTPSSGGVQSAYPFALLPGIITFEKEFEGIILKGLDASYPVDFISKYIKQGELPDLNAGSSSRGILLSEQTARRLRVDTSDRMIIYFVVEGQQLRRSFKVSGIYRTGLEEYDKKFALIDIRDIQEILRWSQDEVGGYEILVDDLEDLDVVTEYIYFEKLPEDLYAESIRRKYPNIFEWLDLQSVNRDLIIVLMLIVAIINMITALLILILERSSMIAVLKSLGATNWQIRKIFLIFSGYILIYGLLWGNVLGLGIAWVQKRFQLLTLDEANYYLSHVPVSIDWSTILFLNVGSFILTLACLLLPSYLVSRLSPIRVLHFR